VIGEFDIRLLMKELTGRKASDAALPLGWGGDRFRLDEGSSGPALVWISLWDEPRHRDWFLSATGNKFMQWFGGGRMEMVPTVANRFLEMMSETVVGWLLLEQAVIADAAAAKLAPDHPDRAFYNGKRYAAQYFANNVLPSVVAKAQMINREDRSMLDIPIAAFASL
jgi:hypothetical protein